MSLCRDGAGCARTSSRPWYVCARTNGEYRLVPDGEPDPAALLSLPEAKPMVFPESDRPDVQALPSRETLMLSNPPLQRTNGRWLRSLSRAPLNEYEVSLGGRRG